MNNKISFRATIILERKGNEEPTIKYMEELLNNKNFKIQLETDLFLEPVFYIKEL